MSSDLLKRCEPARLPVECKSRLRTVRAGEPVAALHLPKRVAIVLLSQDGVMLEQIAKELGLPFDPREYADAIVHPNRRIVWE